MESVPLNLVWFTVTKAFDRSTAFATLLSGGGSGALNPRRLNRRRDLNTAPDYIPTCGDCTIGH